MKEFSRLFTVLLMGAALTGWVACSSDNGTGTTDTMGGDTPISTDTPATDTTPGTDAATSDTTPGTDAATTDTTPGTDATTDTTTDTGTDTGADIPCTANCTDKTCGDDGCGGSCGTCTDPQVCGPAGTCVDAVPPPTTWGPSGAIDSLQTPPDSATAATTCFDFTGDGQGDSSLAGLASQINGPLADAISKGQIGIVMEFAGVTDFTSTASFTLNGLLSKPGATAGEYEIDPQSYDPATGKPLISFAGSAIATGTLSTPKSKFTLSIPVEGIPLTATLKDAQIKGTIDATSGADGVKLTNGVLAGILTKAEVDTIIANLQTTCDAASDAKPSYCQYLTVAKSAESLLFSLHDNGDGTYSKKGAGVTGDAAAACFTFTLAKAKAIPQTAPAAQ